MTKRTIPAAKGKLGVLMPGMGAVTSTFIAGVQLARKGLARPLGSLTQFQNIRLGKRYENRAPLIKNFVPLAALEDLTFGGWDIFEDSMWDAAMNAGVLAEHQLAPVRKELESVVPMPAVFDQAYVRNLKARQFKKGATKMHLAEQLMKDIELFKKSSGADRLVMVWCGSTEVSMERTAAHETVESLEKAMKANSQDVPPSMIYAYAAIRSGIPYANGAPNLSADIPALVDLAEKNGVPICGKD
ncbi:MAG: inositol-3-phosphate synthase, partial [Elusimicrobia bacterium]|nr:inositol-3-phosphate synthase [Elusimicrobiota bacterium]